MKRLIGIAVTVGLAGALLVPTAAVASSDRSKTLGLTAMRVNASVTEALLKSNITVNGEDPGGSTILPPGKLALSFPISDVKNGKASHLGELFISHNGAMGWRTVVVSNLTANLEAGTLKGRVYATDTDLGKKTMFTLAHVKNDSGMYDFTLKLTADGAATLNSSLNVTVFAAGMRVGSGMTMMMPPS